MSNVSNKKARPDWRSLEDLAFRNGMTADHVVLEEEERLDEFSMDPKTIRQRFELNNRVRGTHTELEIFAEGILRISERRDNHLKGQFCIDLRHFASRPMTSRRVTSIAGHAAWISVVFSAAACLLVYFGVLRGQTTVLALAFPVLVAGAIRTYVNSLEEHIALRTRYGEALVRVLTTTFGCMRDGRELAQTLSSEVKRIQHRDHRDRNRRLRAEIREHYRLSETGAISKRVCAAAVRRTLAYFD